MANIDFDFFEAVVGELSGSSSRVLTRRQFENRVSGKPGSLKAVVSQSSLLDDLAEEHSETSTARAIEKSIEYLAEHFRVRDSSLPFSYKSSAGLFKVRDAEFLNFIEKAKKLRSVASHGKAFELAVMERLFVRTKGTVHRVGSPRDIHKTVKACNNFLKSLGFGDNTLQSKAGDGGFDLIWELPLGVDPYRPLALVQCKNGSFDWKEADHSVMACGRSLEKHKGLSASAHIHFVMFNGYITPDILPNVKMNYVPLGISDLSRLSAISRTNAI